MDLSVYENLVIERNVCSKDIILALNFVKKYIMQHKLILTGGMAIDLALREKNNKLYDDNTLPDYDFYSSAHYEDAYNIGQELCLMGLPNITIINALHSTTMRVRVNFEPVADISYIPANILSNIPTIRNKEGLIFEHPHYKMINIHRALSYPYANAPYDVILQRFDKDMYRFDLLYEFYPLPAPKITIKTKKIMLPADILRGECIFGFVALDYWKNMTETLPTNFMLPEDTEIMLLSNNVEKLKDKIIKKIGAATVTRYGVILDIIPPRIEIKTKNSTYILLSAHNQLTGAHKIKGDIWVANPQILMVYFLFNYIMGAEYQKETFLWGYLQCYELVKSADPDNDLEKNLLPTYEVYGKENLDWSDKLVEDRILEKNKVLAPPKFPLQPNSKRLAADKCIIDPTVNNFDFDKSDIFKIDGAVI